jgi:hypothetical protein
MRLIKRVVFCRTHDHAIFFTNTCSSLKGARLDIRAFNISIDLSPFIYLPVIRFNRVRVRVTVYSTSVQRARDVGQGIK